MDDLRVKLITRWLQRELDCPGPTGEARNLALQMAHHAAGPGAGALRLRVHMAKDLAR